MKKYLALCLCLNLLWGCSEKKADETTTTEETEIQTQENEPKKIELTKAPSIDFAKKSFSFKKDSLSEGCSDESDVICAINLSIKCTIDSKRAECDKSKMPKFIFMEDESLERPTELEYKIIKLKPIAEGQLEVYTQSTCNGSWFGLCNGNIIYVMAQKNNQWTVKDLYALQTVK